MLKRKGFYGLILAIVVLTLFLPACFKLGGEPSIDAEFTLTREISLMGISEFAFSVDVKGVKDAAVVEFDNGMPSVALSGGKAESRFFANIGTGEVTLSVRDSRGVELLKKTVTLEETKLTFDMAAVEDKTGIYVLIDDDFIFYSLECLENMTFTEKVELLTEVIFVNDSYVVIQSGDAWIWDFETYPNNPKYDLTQDTLDTLGLPNYALSICEGGFFNILNGKSLYQLVVEIDPEEGGEVEIDPDQILYEEGTEVSLTAVPASAEWLFGSWSGDLISTDPVETIVMDEDMVITANFYEAEDPYVGEPDEMVVCSGEEFSIVVPGDADEVEITFDGVTKAAVEDPEGLFTATFTAPVVAKDITRPIDIWAVKGPKELTWTWEDKITVKAEEIMVINEFFVEPFDCDAEGTEIVVITCCEPEPDMNASFIQIEYGETGEIITLWDPVVSPLPGCEVKLTYNWDFPKVACSDATVTAYVRSLCSDYAIARLEVQNISNLTSEDVIEIGFNPDEVDCDATTLTFPVKINFFDSLNITKVEAYVCNGYIVDRFGKEAELLGTGEAILTYNFENLDCEEACVAVKIWAEDCGDCESYFELCYSFDIDNVAPRNLDGVHVDINCNSFETPVTWNFYDNCFVETSIQVTHGKLFHYELVGEQWIWVDKGQSVDMLGYKDDGKWKWTFPGMSCEDIEIVITGEDDCGNITTWEKAFFVDNVAPVIHFEELPNICDPKTNQIVFSWNLSDCQAATLTSWAVYPKGYSELSVDEGSLITIEATTLSPWESGKASGIATITWENPLDCVDFDVVLTAIDECGNIGSRKNTFNIDTSEPEIIEFYVEGGTVCGTQEAEIHYLINENCLDYVEITVSKGCLVGGAKCDTWYCYGDCSAGIVDWLLPEIDCEELTVTLTAMDKCGHMTTKEIKVTVDNVDPSLMVDFNEPDKCATFTTFKWDSYDACFDEVSISVNTGTLTFDASTLEYFDENEGKLPSFGAATWTFAGLDCEEIELEIVALDSCGNSDSFNYSRVIDNVAPRIDYWAFDMLPVPDPEGLCDVTYNSPITYLTWEATDNCPGAFDIFVGIGDIEHWEIVGYDNGSPVYGWVKYTEGFPWKDDGYWRWNIGTTDCVWTEISFTANDDCASVSQGTEVKVDTLEPDISLAVGPYDECNAECVTLTWTIWSEDCLVCNDNCIEWFVGEIEVDKGTINGKKKAQISIPCDCELPISGSLNWCFGELDCKEAITATFTAWDTAGNKAKATVAVNDIDNKAPVINNFLVNTPLSYDVNGDPYVELAWDVSDNCFNIASVWVSQGKLKAFLPEEPGYESQAAFFVPDDFTDQYISKSAQKVIYWYLDDPNVDGTAWLAAQDVCCNESVATTEYISCTAEVTVRADPEVGGTVDGGGRFPCNSSVTVKAYPDDCYDFDGWFVGETLVSKDAEYTFTVTEDVDLVAKFTLKTFEVTVTAEPKEGGEVMGADTYDCGEEATVVATPAECYDFDGWFVDDTLLSKDAEYTFTVTEDVDLVAKFTLKTFEVVATAGENGTITPEGTQTVECGDNITFAIVPDDCYYILDVLVDGESVGAVETYTFENVRDDHAIEALFEKFTYEVVATAGENGTITPEGTQTVECGDDITFTITPDECYEIADVLVDGVSFGAIDTYTFSDVKANHTIEAVFARLTYAVEATAGVGGTITPEGVQTVLCGDDITFTITPDSGYEIEDVLVDGVSFGAVDTYTFSDVKANHTIEAVFRMLPIPLQIISLQAGKDGEITVLFNRDIRPSDNVDANYFDVMVGGQSIDFAFLGAAGSEAGLKLNIPCIIGPSLPVEVNGFGLSALFSVEATVKSSEIVVQQDKFTVSGTKGPEVAKLGFVADDGTFIVLPPTSSVLPVDIFVKFGYKLLTVLAFNASDELIGSEIHLLPKPLCGSANWIEDSPDPFNISKYSVTASRNLEVYRYVLTTDAGDPYIVDNGDVLPAIIENPDVTITIPDLRTPIAATKLTVSARDAGDAEIGKVVINLVKP